MVLSNNDGCVIARSNEAKALGIEMGDPPASLEKVTPHFTHLKRYAILAGIGHNLPQEAPAALADAVLELG